MLSKCVVILLLVAFETRCIYGQYFRKDYKYIENEQSFYKISSTQKTWKQAQIACLREGATLFFPERKAEAKSVMALWNMQKPDIPQMYVGIANWNVEEIYEAVDGRRLSSLYHIWATGEPSKNYGNESCVVMERDGAYRVDDCDTVHHFICKKTSKSVKWNNECDLPDLSYVYNKELNRCYKFHLTPKNWTDAYLTCNAEESYLAIINSPEEDEYFINITAAAPKDSIEGDYLRGAVHLGYHYKIGVWQTIKGVLLEDSGFGGGWANSQPDGEGTETCGSMFYTGELNDIGCWQRMFFICEHEITRNSETLRIQTPAVIQQN